MVDISHESLIRQWEEFAAWLQQEIAAAGAWRRLVDQTERHQRGEADLLTGVALANLASWWDTERPTAAWAARYGGDFAAAQAFLEESRRAEEAAKQAEIEARRRSTRRRALAVVVVMLVVTVTAGVVAYLQTQAARRAEDQRIYAEQQRTKAEDAARAAEAAQRQAAEFGRDRRQGEAAGARCGNRRARRADGCGGRRHARRG